MAVILKRIRSEQEDEIMPVKRNKFQLCSTFDRGQVGGGGLNEELMTYGGEEDDAMMVMDEEVEMMDDHEPELDPSNPLHPWNAPRMLHQISTNSLSSISSSNNSFPGTPLDAPTSSQIFPINSYSNSNIPFPDQFTHPHHSTIFPTPHNPTSFTDQNGVTRSFPPPSNSTAPVTSMALSPYPPSPQFESDDPAAFANYALSHLSTTSTPTPLSSPNTYAKDQYQSQMRGRIQIVTPDRHGYEWNGGGEMEEMMLGGMGMGFERELELPKYNWDVDRPALAMGGHQI